MKRTAVTGLSGVIGKILIEELPGDIEIIDLYHKKRSSSPKIKYHKKLDLFDKKKIIKVLGDVKPDVVLHMAAITHIDRCEEDKKNGKNGIVWKINVEATAEIAKFCSTNRIPIIFLSTECVFDGKKKFFSEKDKKNSINWYGFTKSKAEDLLLSSGAPVSIIRSVVAYHIKDANKTIYGKILKELKTRGYVCAVYNQMFTPTSTYDIVNAINKVIKNKSLGIYHVAPKKSISPYNFALLVADRNGYSSSLVKKTTLESFYSHERAALRLKNACLFGEKSDNILKFIPKDPKEILQK